MSLRLGVDVGGTFTDVLLVSEETGDLTIAKVLSTPEDQSLGVMAGVKQACETHGVGLDALSLILHGSTVVTNMILEEKGAVGGLLTTAGHEQILHLARAWTPGPLYAWMGMIKPDPLVPLWLTRGVPERTSASGEVITAIDEDATRAAIEDLLASGTESLTIAFLNAYVNPAHERRAREIALELRPGLPVSISSDLVSEYREYERTLTAVLNSYTQPQVIKYVDGLESLLGDAGFKGRLNIVRSDGGTMSARSTKERPVDIAFSGPSGGAVGAAYLARRMGVPNVLTFDMGGTSTDVALCRDGEVAIKREAQLGYYQFQARGADIHSVGAGGGSIAYLNLAGALKVGPRSAGADPGPACYGRGGDGADGHRRQRRARPAPGRVEARRAPGARRRGGRAGRGDGRRGAGHRHRGRRAGDHRHRQREHARRAARRVASSAATTRATSGSSPSAARARCTPTRSRASSAPTR